MRGANAPATIAKWPRLGHSRPESQLHRFLSISIKASLSNVNGAADRGDCTAMAKLATLERRRSSDTGYPPIESAGYLVRDAHRAFQKLLEKRIAASGIARGQWYFLRVLWIEDGLSQRELSTRVGMMEPTTVIALRRMEKAGLRRRVGS